MRAHSFDRNCRRAKFDEAVAGFSFLKPQVAPAGSTNSYWAYSLILETERPETDWFKFRACCRAELMGLSRELSGPHADEIMMVTGEMFLANGGDDVYACCAPHAHCAARFAFGLTQLLRLVCL